MADVTHIGEPRSGFTKMSTWCTVTANHEIYNLTAGYQAHEDFETFLNELDFLIECVPSIADSERSLVILVDGDRGRIKAIHNRLPHAKVYMCALGLWLAANSFQAFGTRARTSSRD
jgi:hypothetical protein